MKSFTVRTLVSITAAFFFSGLLLSNAQATGSSDNIDTTSYFDGLYAGLEAGGIWTITDTHIQHYPSAVSETYDGYDTSFVPAVDVGYSKSFGHYYLGLQLEFDLLSTQTNEYDQGQKLVHTYDREVTVQQMAALDLQPGYLITPQWLVYGDVGAAYMWQRYTQIRDGNQNESTDDNQVYLLQPKFGVGTAFALNSHLSFNMIISYIVDANAQTFVATGTQENYTENVSELRYMGGVNLRF